MATDDGPGSDDYHLNRTFAASARLNLQHYLWRTTFNHQLLHQAIPVTEKQLKVADVATGTGIWLLDFAREHPDAQLDGLDISLDQLPPAEWLPSNVSFQCYDVRQKPRKDLVDKYDIIHVRHLNLVVKNNDPMPVLGHLMTMLKPGGYLQWGEFDLGNLKVVTAHSDCPTDLIEELHTRIGDFRPIQAATWPDKLGDVFRTAGLQDVSFGGKWTEYGYLSYHMDVGLLVFEEMIDELESHEEHDPADIDQLRGLLKGAVHQSRQGAAWSLRSVIAVGRKPV